MKIRPEVERFSVGDQVFSLADNTYAELCVLSAAILVKVPEGLDLTIGGAAAGDDNGQPAPFGYGNQGGPRWFWSQALWEMSGVRRYSPPRNAGRLLMAEAVRDGKLVIPISETLPLRQAAEAQAAAEKGVAGKILLVA